MQDLRDAFRALCATPIVTTVAVLSLALGIGANTAIFSIFDSLMLRTLPVRNPQQLVIVGSGTDDRSFLTNPIWEQIRERESLFGGAFAWANTRFNLAQGGQTEFVDGLWASGALFDVLGVQPVLGRMMTRDDDRRGGGPDGPVAVVSYAFWQRRFNGAADAIGRSITVERVPFTIVGVTPPSFFGTDVGRTFDVAIPLGTEPLIRGRESSLDRRSSWWLTVMLRMKDGRDLSETQSSLRSFQPQLREATIPQDWGEADKAGYLKEPFRLTPAATGGSPLRARYERPLTTIMVIVALVLLIACANIANLLLARSTARRHELSVRAALGASRIRIARQLLAESLLLSGAGAVAGLLVAFWGSRLLVRQLSSSFSNVFLDLSLNWRVLGFTAAIAVGTALLFGIVPALRGTRAQPNDALKAQGRANTTEGRFGLAGMLVALQVALSLVLLIGAGLFVRTFARLAQQHVGFNPRPVLVANVNMQRLQLEPPQRQQLYQRLLEQVVAVPGVATASLSVITPVGGSAWNNRIDVPGMPEMAPRERQAFINAVSGNWFSTYGTPLLAGRDFTAADTHGTAPVAIVNEAFARRFTYGKNPVGMRLRQPGFPGRPAVEREIVGYAKDAVYRSLRDPVPPTLYVPFAQEEEIWSSAAISVRAAAGSPVLLTRSVAAALTGVNRDISITFRPLQDHIDTAVTQERIVAMLSGFFGVLALLLAALGLYGVTSYAVTRQRTEIGIRLALGAAPVGIVQMVLRRVAILVVVGVAAGASVSAWAARFVTTLLYGMQPRDPLTFAGATLVLATIAAFAGWLPARRASRIDPATALREG
jgi:putative ABC transport system permease protein